MMATKEALCEKRQGNAEAPRRILFVCTGNTCRSPMAAALLNDKTRIPPLCSMCDVEKLMNAKKIRAISAGLFATGAPIAPNAVSALVKAGVHATPDNPYTSHRSRTLDEETAASCDVIVGMTSAHALQIMLAFPEHASKITSMPCDVPDPYGGDEAVYDACLAAINEGIHTLFFAEVPHENGNS